MFQNLINGSLSIRVLCHSWVGLWILAITLLNSVWNFVRWWTLPRNDLSCLCVVGGFRFNIACVFETVSVLFLLFHILTILFCLWQSDTCLCWLLGFRCLVCLSSWIDVSCGFLYHLLWLIILSRKPNVFVRLYSVLSIAFWNSVGIAVRP